LLTFFQAVLHEHLRVGSAGTCVQFRGIDLQGSCAFIIDQVLEEVFIVYNIAEILVLTVQPVSATDRLEQTVVLHGFVDVKISTGRRIKACEQLVHHYEQLHVSWLFDEQCLGMFFVGLGLCHARIGFDIPEQFSVCVIDELFICFGVGAGVLFGHVPGLRIVGCHYSAFAF